MLERQPAPSKRYRCPDWLADIRKSFKRHRVGRPGWVVNEANGRLRLLSPELSPRPGEPSTDYPDRKVRHIS